MKDNLKKLLQVRNLANGEAALYFYGEIVSSWWDTWDSSDKYPEAIRRFLDGLTGQPLHIYINSPGGSVFAGMAIYNMLCRYQGRKTTHIDGIAASVASVIAMAGDSIIMPENTMMMIHRASGNIWGNRDELARYVELLDKVDEAILSVYTKRLSNPDDAERVKGLVAKETYLTAGDTSALFSGVTVEAPLEMVARAKNADAIYSASLEYERLRLLDISNRRNVQ